MAIELGMTYDQLIEFFKTQAAAARALNIKQPSISAWRIKGIPKIRQYHIENVTGGALKAERRA